ncbi:unannotated protein [freshwater metagenome]|uniref:Unannotated protein n=1 Tax=freshwater metagenome TaxID=449393 RepID=A0A6J7C3V9_9ZZZZ
MEGSTTTRSPTLTLVTDAPTALTVPATSIPAMCGSVKPGNAYQPLRCTTSR